MILRETVAAAALTNERVICVARTVFYLAIVLRFLWVAELTPARTLLTVGPLALGAAFSIVVLVAVRRTPRGDALWIASVLIDATVCFFVLLPNALYSAPAYAGVSLASDTAGLLVVTVGAGLRLSPRAAVIGGAVSIAAFGGLVAVDEAVSGARFATSPAAVSMYLVYLATCTALATIFTVLTRRLVIRGSGAALRAEAAEQRLWAVVADHHDLRSLLTSAMLGAEALSTRLDQGDGGAEGAPLQETAGALRDDLRRVGHIVRAVRGRTVDDLEVAGAVCVVDVRETLTQLVAEVGRRHQGVAFHDADGTPPIAARVAGGATSLARILRNLLDNAAEGDGQRHARAVTVAVEVDDATRTVRFGIQDDGPGFAPEVLAAAPDGVRSTKPDGAGLGLAAARGLVEASGGRLTLANGQGGAHATFTLPVADPAQLDATS